MRLIIQTQYRENYGAHSWDGKGECPQYWKNKGGSTYVVNDVSALMFAEFKTIIEKAIQFFDCAYSNDYSEEYVIDWHFDDSGFPKWEEWETPKEVSLEKLI